MMRIIDDFLPNIGQVRAAGLVALYIDWKGYDGQMYKRVCLTDIPGLQDRLEHEVGPVDIFGMGYRLNYAGELPNTAIHSDMGWGTHALVVYLSDGDSGTALWRHNATGADRIDPGDFDLFEQINGDWDNPAAWTQTAMARMRLNRAVIYDGSLFHSRWPFEGFGTDPQTGRLIAVAFFTPRGNP